MCAMIFSPHLHSDAKYGTHIPYQRGQLALRQGWYPYWCNEVLLENIFHMAHTTSLEAYA